MKKIELILILLFSLFLISCGEQEKNSVQLAAYQNSTTVFENNTTTFSNSTTVFGNNADTNAPSVPLNFSVLALSYTEIKLLWDASTDNVGVAGYKIYNKGNNLGIISETAITYSNLKSGSRYCFNVSAVDFAGNESTKSAPEEICVETFVAWYLGNFGSNFSETDIAKDELGNIYVTGATGGTSADSKDVFIAKFDSNGYKQWLIKKELSLFQRGEALAVVGNRVYLLWNSGTWGLGDGYYYLSAFDADNPSEQWEELWTITPPTKCHEITADSNVIYVGSFRGTIYQVDFNGNIGWSAGIGDVITKLAVYGDYVYSVYASNFGGNSVAKLDRSNGAIVWKKEGLRGNMSVAVDSSGIYVSGNEGSYAEYVNSGAAIIGAVTHFDFDGNVLWEEFYNTDFGFRGVAVDDTGVYATGYYFDTVKFSKDSGQILWEQPISSGWSLTFNGNIVYLVESGGDFIQLLNAGSGDLVYWE